MFHEQGDDELRPLKMSFQEFQKEQWGEPTFQERVSK